jgi:GNAT superfamily N-acetyltransferase
MPVDARLASMAEETIWLGCAAYGAVPLVEVGERWYLTGTDYPGLNGIFPVSGPVDVTAAHHPYQRRAVPVLWHLGPDAPRGLAARLIDAGAVFDEAEPLMVADLLDPPPAAPPVPGLEIVEVTGDAGLAEFGRIWSGSGDPAAIEELVRLRGGPGPVFEHLLGVLDGVPVACAAAFHGPRAGEVQHVVTRPAARRRGIGAALTRRLLACMHERGTRTAVLTASPYGTRIYQRLGFRQVGVVRRYLWRPAC